MNIKRKKILDAAFNLFYQRGFHAIGINEIIQQANVAKKTLYNHFQSKDELILATLELHHQLIMQQLKQKLKFSVPGKDSILIIFELLDEWINGEIKALPTFNGCYFTQAHVEFSTINPEITSFCLSHKQDFQSIFQSQANDFENNIQKNQLVVDLLVLLKEGVINNAQMLSQKNSAQQAMRYIENMLRFKR